MFAFVSGDLFHCRLRYVDAPATFASALKPEAAQTVPVNTHRRWFSADGAVCLGTRQGEVVSKAIHFIPPNSEHRRSLPTALKCPHVKGTPKGAGPHPEPITNALEAPPRAAPCREEGLPMRYLLAVPASTPRSGSRRLALEA